MISPSTFSSEIGTMTEVLRMAQKFVCNHFVDYNPYSAMADAVEATPAFSSSSPTVTTPLLVRHPLFVSFR
jgi:hypothetical protein